MNSVCMHNILSAGPRSWGPSHLVPQQGVLQQGVLYAVFDIPLPVRLFMSLETFWERTGYLKVRTLDMHENGVHATLDQGTSRGIKEKLTKPTSFNPSYAGGGPQKYFIYAKICSVLTASNGSYSIKSCATLQWLVTNFVVRLD